MAELLTESGWDAGKRVVSVALGAQIRPGRGPEPRFVGIRSRVARVELVGGSGEFRAAVVKERVDGSGGGYEPVDRAPGSFASRVAYESAALEFLANGERRRLCPRLIGVDYDAGVIVMEDLGEGVGLLERLQGDDPERADEALCLYGRAMGELHAISAGRDAEFGFLLERFGNRPANPLANVVHEHIRRFERAIEAAECTIPSEVYAFLNVTAARMCESGPFLALTHGDICPGHDRILDDRTVFIDWELAGFRHAFYDLAYLYVPFPSCGFAGQVPTRSLAKAVAAYRETAACGIPAVADDDQFRAELAYAWMFWVVRDVGAMLPAALDADTEWGTATHRQRIVHLLQGFAASYDLRNEHSAVVGWVADLHNSLQQRWPDIAQLPIYPAYREGSLTRQ